MAAVAYTMGVSVVHTGVAHFAKASCKSLSVIRPSNSSFASSKKPLGRCFSRLSSAGASLKLETGAEQVENQACSISGSDRAMAAVAYGVAHFATASWKFLPPSNSSFASSKKLLGRCFSRGLCSARASLKPETGTEQVENQASTSLGSDGRVNESRPSSSPRVQKELNEAVKKTAATFAPRASTASKKPAPPGSTLYQVFEAQAYIAMVLGGALSFNLLFPSDHPDVWRLMGMWSVWMFTVPSLRARDCSIKEKDALNYLFLVIPIINVTIPLVWKSFAAVWSADVLAFFTIYAWKMEWLSDANRSDDL